MPSEWTRVYSRMVRPSLANQLSTKDGPDVVFLYIFRRFRQ